MVAGDVHGDLTVTGEPFCGLLGMTVRWKDPFVLETVLSIRRLAGSTQTFPSTRVSTLASNVRTQ